MPKLLRGLTRSRQPTKFRGFGEVEPDFFDDAFAEG
jgi:hypothetical protein